MISVPPHLWPIVGETGCGKTTILRLLSSIIQPGSGRIVLYDALGKETEGTGMRSHIVYIEQGNTLMSGTIRDNLLLANPVATDEQLTEALHVACADFVFSLPAGMDTKIGEHATRLSGGQAQRIAIARSLCAKVTFCCWMKSAHRWMPKPRSFFSTASLLRMPIRLLSVLRIGRRWQTDARSRYGCDEMP